MPQALSTQEIVALLRELLVELLEIDISEVTLDSDLTDGLCVDSLQQLELMTRVERRLHITLDIDAWLTPATVAHLAQHITARQEDRNDG
jgi:acyl carrier protein